MILVKNGLGAFGTDGFVLVSAGHRVVDTDLKPGIGRELAAGIDFDFISTRQKLEKFHCFVVHRGRMANAGGGVQCNLGR